MLITVGYRAMVSLAAMVSFTPSITSVNYKSGNIRHFQSRRSTVRIYTSGSLMMYVRWGDFDLFGSYLNWGKF